MAQDRGWRRPLKHEWAKHISGRRVRTRSFRATRTTYPDSLCLITLVTSQKTLNLLHCSTFGTPRPPDQGGGRGGPHLTISRCPTRLSTSTFPYAYQEMTVDEKPAPQRAVSLRNGAPKDFGGPRRSMPCPRYCCAVDTRLPTASMYKDLFVQSLTTATFDSVGAQRGRMCRRRNDFVQKARKRKCFRQNGPRIHVSMAC